MDAVLVVGTESAVGANLAAHWTDAGEAVAGASRGLGVTEEPAGPIALDEARRLLQANDAGRVVYCGPAAEPCWSNPRGLNAQAGRDAEADLRVWIRAARDAGCRFTYLSSDAVFTGPWMFHAEDGRGHCPSPTANRLREFEELVRRVLPEALVVRTHAYGWSPEGEADGYVESLLADLERGTATADPVRHATPILATDLADVLLRAHEEELAGALHVAGAERVSHAEFVRRLADEFDLPAPIVRPVGTLAAAATGFGGGETSLLTRRAKNVLNLALPMLGDGLGRLRFQSIDGVRGRLADVEPELLRAA